MIDHRNKSGMGRLSTLATGSLFLFASAVGLPTPVRAQDSGACFLLDESGKRVDLGSLCGKAGNARQANSFKTPIKRRRGGIPIIDVTFNGRETFEMLVDTGASGVVIPPEVARQLNLRQERTVLVSTPSSRGVALPAGRVESIEVAGIVARNIEVIVTPALDLGLLGQSFFGDFDVIIRSDSIEFQRR